MKSLVIATLFALIPLPVQAQDFAGVGRAVDGDSLFVGGREVRLHGIDAPEYRQTCRLGWSNWSCGADAAVALRSIVDGRQLTCTPIDRDVYGRTVAQCRAGAADVGAAMLERGVAVRLDNAPAHYAQIEGQSRASRAGIWASEFELPSLYRAAHPRGGAGSATRLPPRPVVRSAPAAPAASLARSAFSYRTCAQAWAAGAAPIRIGEYGYGPHLDGDHDGIACEPFRRR